MGESYKINLGKQNPRNKIMDKVKQPTKTIQTPSEIKKARIFCKEIELFAQSLNQEVQTVLDKYPAL